MSNFVYWVVLFIVAVVTATLVQEALDRVFPMRCKDIAECVYSWELVFRAFISCLVALFVMFGVAYILWLLGFR